MPRSGASWERVLEVAHTDYRRAGLADVRRVHPPGRRAKGPVDFMGVLAGGRAVRFDAKVRAERFGISELRRHQALQLDVAHRLGGLAGIALRIRSEESGWWWLDWSALGPIYWRDVKGPRTIGVLQADDLGRRMPEAGRWLEVAL